MVVQRVIAWSVLSAQLRGVEALPVRVRAELRKESIPGLTITGMPDRDVIEARARVRSAISHSGFEVPRCGVEITLEPMGIRKTGSGYDLAIALAILVASGQVAPSVTRGRLFYGELCLNGDVLACRGTICVQECAAREGLVPVVSPEAETIDDYAPALELSNLSELADGGLREHLDAKPKMGGCPRYLSEVEGHEEAKRQIVAAAKARRSMVLVGKDERLLRKLAECVPSVLGDDAETQRQTELVRSAAGLGTSKCRRPVRFVSPSISCGALVGGGRPVIPGEVSLANGGVLVLEDAERFDERQLSVLERARKDGSVSLVRVDGCYSFPASFLLVGICRANARTRAGRESISRLGQSFDSVIVVTDEAQMADGKSAEAR